MAAEGKLDQVQAAVMFRQQIGEMIDIAKAVCKVGQSVDDFVSLLDLSLSNDMLLSILMDKVSQLELSKEV